jgi:hypothetical protein
MASITDSVARILILNSGFSLDLDRGLRGQELILDIFNPFRAHNEAVLAARYFSAFSPT